MPYEGELAALGTAFCWALSAVAFAAAGTRVGSMPINLIRLVMAIALLSLGQLGLRGKAFPFDATADAWGWLVLSGLIGFTFGDGCLFRAFVLLGPRLSSLVMSTAPMMTALAGYLVLGEQLRALQWFAMALTMSGVAWAVLSREPVKVAAARASSKSQSARWKGVLFALGGAAGQALGLVLSKHGMGDYHPMAATQIRVVGGIAGFVVVFVVAGWGGRLRRALRNPRAMAACFAGATFGPFLGVTLSLAAVQRAPTGVAASIMATTPVLIIPFAIWVRKERVGVGGFGGAIVAVAGVVVLFLA